MNGRKKGEHQIVMLEKVVSRVIDQLVYPAGNDVSADVLQQSQFYREQTLKNKKLINQIITTSVLEALTELSTVG